MIERLRNLLLVNVNMSNSAEYEYNLEQVNKVHDRFKPSEAILNVQLGCFSKDYSGFVMFVHPREHELIDDVEIMENIQKLSELTQYAHDNKTISTSHIYPNKYYDYLVAKNKKLKCGIGYPIILPVEELKKLNIWISYLLHTIRYLCMSIVMFFIAFL